MQLKLEIDERLWLQAYAMNLFQQIIYVIHW